MPKIEETAVARLLILEENERYRREMEVLLRQEGFGTRTAESEAEALELLARESFDLLLLSLNFIKPMGGLGLCKRIKSNPSLSWLPVLFSTESVNREMIAQAFDCGGDEFISKPFRSDEAAIRVRVLVRKGKEARWLVERARKLAEKIAERDDELDDLRQFAQDIVGSLSSALVVLGPNQTILFANAPFLHAVGEDRRNAMGRRADEFLRNDLLNGGLGQAIRAALAQGKTSRLRRAAELFQRTPNVICDVTVTAIEYAGVRQALLIIEDVTEQAQAESEITLERGKLNDIVNAMNAALCLIDMSLNVLWENRTFSLWFGDDLGGAARESFLRSLRDDGEWIGRVFTRGQPAPRTWTLFTPQGQRRHFFSIIAPIKTGASVIKQALILTQDVTEQETRVEQLQLLSELSQSLQGTLDAERLYHVILLCVTAGHALGFNRAFLFTRNRSAGTLEGRMAVGPANREDAFRTWARLSQDGQSFVELLRQLENPPPKETLPLYPVIRNLNWRLDDPSEIVVRTALEKRAQIVSDADSDVRVSQRFRRIFGCREFVAIPMIAKDSVVGVILADNLYSGRPITDEHVQLLTLFATQAALAIENAETYAELQIRMKELNAVQEEVVHAEKLAAIGKMAAHVAHEIRNPLATIGGFARAILKNPDNPARIVKSAQIIAEESMRLEQMLKGVMDFSRPSPPIFQTKNINDTAEKAFRTQAEHLASRKIIAQLDLDRSLPDLSHDETQIVQLLHNLIRNAAEAMPEGGALTVSSGREGDWIVLRISDTGVGISPEKMKTVFQPFQTTKKEGTGLGLAVTKKIVDDHEGRIEVQSVEGKGTTFSVKLPLTPETRRPRFLQPDAVLPGASSDNERASG